MNNKSLHIAIEVIEEYFPSASTAFLATCNRHKNFKSIKIIIVNEIYDYYSFEHFFMKGYNIEVIILPKSIISFTDKHLNFIKEYDIFNSISKAKIIRDTNLAGERLQQMYEVINMTLMSSKSNEKYNNIFKLSCLIDEYENIKNTDSTFIIKNKIVNKINNLLENHPNYLSKIVKLQDSFTNDNSFLNEVKSILEDFGGALIFYSENDVLNIIAENEFSLLIETTFTYDDFISLFLIHLLNKLKVITHKIKFTFKVINDNQYLVTIWSENEIIKNHIIPTLNQIFISNIELYNSLKPKYPYYNKKQRIDNLLIDADLIKELQLHLSKYILELKLNEKEELTDGYRLTLAIFFSIEILQASLKDKDKAKIATNLIFEEWLSMSYDTSNTNWNDLELQSYKILNELENLYLAQYETLNLNFGNSLEKWQYTDESGLEIKKNIKKVHDSYNNESVLNSNNNNSIEGINNSIQIILFEVLNILGISNYNKTYTIYAINRLLHEA